MRLASLSRTPVLLALAACLFLAAPVGAAQTPGTSATLVFLGIGDVRGNVPALAGQVVFRNITTGSTRIVFARSALEGVTCEADGEDVIRSRSGQYLLRRGAELSCTVVPGRYRYTTVTLSGDQVSESRATLHVKK